MLTQPFPINRATNTGVLRLYPQLLSTNKRFPPPSLSDPEHIAYVLMTSVDGYGRRVSFSFVIGNNMCSIRQIPGRCHGCNLTQGVSKPRGGGILKVEDASSGRLLFLCPGPDKGIPSISVL